MPKFTEVAKPGMAYAARLHAAGCADVRKDRRRGYTDVASWSGTVQGWKEAMFGDVAGDSFDSETQRAEWLAEVDYQASDATICACAVALDKAAARAADPEQWTQNALF